MMLQGSSEENKLYERLRAATDPKEIEEIREKLREIANEERNQFGDMGFAH